MATVAELTTVDDALARVAEIEPQIRQYAPDAEREKRLAAPVAALLRDAGLYHLFRPSTLGGMGLDPVSGFKVLEELSRIDSAAGWNASIANASEPFGAWFSESIAQEIFGTPETVMAGAWNPPRQAVEVEGGYHVTGRTFFGSNCHAANWFIGLAHIVEGDDVRMDESGAPVTLLTLQPMNDARIEENWNTLGMRGTGSHDIVMEDVFVPYERAVSLAPLETVCESYSWPFHRLSSWPSVAAQAPPALGIARAAIDEFIAMATMKTPAYTASALRNRTVVQLQVAQAEAKLSSAQALLYNVMDELWQIAVSGRRLQMKDRAKCQMAATNAVTLSAEAVDLIHLAAGASAIRDEQPFQRYFRDIHVITQHAFVSASRLESVGQVMLGLEPEWPFFQM